MRQKWGVCHACFRLGCLSVTRLLSSEPILESREKENSLIVNMGGSCQSGGVHATYQTDSGLIHAIMTKPKVNYIEASSALLL